MSWIAPVQQEGGPAKWEDQVIMTCVAMGCPDDSFPANAVTSDREANHDFVRYVGFGD